MEREYEFSYNDIVIRLLERKENFVTFLALDPEARDILLLDEFERLKYLEKYHKLKYRECLYILGRIGLYEAIPIITVVLTSTEDQVIGYVKDTNKMRINFREIGKLQMNIINDKALVWECYVYSDFMNYLEQVILSLEQLIKERYPNVKHIYMHGDEPLYPKTFNELLEKLNYQLLYRVPETVYYKQL